MRIITTKSGERLLNSLHSNPNHTENVTLRGVKHTAVYSCTSTGMQSCDLYAVDGTQVGKGYFFSTMDAAFAHAARL